MFLNILNTLAVAIGYYMGMAFAKLQQQKQKDRRLQTQKSREIDAEGDKNDKQKKCLYFHTFEVFLFQFFDWLPKRTKTLICRSWNGTLAFSATGRILEGCLVCLVVILSQIIASNEVLEIQAKKLNLPIFFA